MDHKARVPPISLFIEECLQHPNKSKEEVFNLTVKKYGLSNISFEDFEAVTNVLQLCPKDTEIMKYILEISKGK